MNRLIYFLVFDKFDFNYKKKIYGDEYLFFMGLYDVLYGFFIIEGMGVGSGMYLCVFYFFWKLCIFNY